MHHCVFQAPNYFTHLPDEGHENFLLFSLKRGSLFFRHYPSNTLQTYVQQAYCHWSVLTLMACRITYFTSSRNFGNIYNNIFTLVSVHYRQTLYNSLFLNISHCPYKHFQMHQFHKMEEYFQPVSSEHGLTQFTFTALFTHFINISTLNKLPNKVTTFSTGLHRHNHFTAHIL
jgi:hypothetical protein